MNERTLIQQQKTPAPVVPPVRSSVLQRKCACGQHTVAGGECAKCRKKRLTSRPNAVSTVNHAEPAMLSFTFNETPRSSSLPSNGVGVNTSTSSNFGHNFADVRVQTNRLAILPQQAVISSGDPIHDPLLEEYRRSTGQPPGGVDESGRQVGPSDAELKYSGILGRFGMARWLSPVINRRNFAEVQFRSTGLAGTGGLTTQFINEQEVHSNQDVETAIPRPSVESRIEGGTTKCWFSRGVNVTGRTTMDIFTSGPWDFTAPRTEVASRYSWDRRCREGAGSATIHIDARPNDAAMEEFIRLGEAEHDTDTHQAFNDNIAVYAANVNRLIGNTPATRVSGPDLSACQSTLSRLENRDLLTQFVVDLNTATARRHAGGRHSIAHTGISINSDCTRITEEMRAGSL